MADTCPVCGKDCSNPGGLAAHLLFVKDAGHQAHRLGGPLLLPVTTTVAPTVPVAPTTTAPTAAAPSVVPPTPATPPATPTVAPPTPPPTPPARPVVLFEIPAPTQTGPLLPDGGPTTTAGGPGGPPPPAVEVPLGPVLAGTVALAVNSALLNRPIDQQVTTAEVGATGFPDAAEACIRLWFPDLPINHPVTALVLSGANLAMLVGAYRGKLAPTTAGAGGGPTTTTITDPTTAGGPAPTTTTTEAKAEPGKTGDPYWDAIFAQAGGLRRDE